MSKLSISSVSPQDEKASIKIIEGDDYNTPYLKYLDETTSEYLPIHEANSMERPLRCSELKKILEKEKWCLGPGKFIKDELLCSTFLLPETEIPSKSQMLRKYTKISENDNSNWKSFVDAMNSEEFNIQDEDREILKELREIYNATNESMKEIYLYNDSVKSIDVLNNTVVMDILKYESDEYTNILSLSDISNTLTADLGSKVDLSIQYSKKGRVYSHTTTFNVSKSSGINDWIEEVSGDVQIEYINDVIRICPVNKEVTECIISNCVVTYGKIGK